MANMDEIGEYDGEIPENDPAHEILGRMLRHNRPIKHIVEDTGYPEEYVKKVKKIVELVKNACSRKEK